MIKRICLNHSVLMFMEARLKECKTPCVVEFGGGWSSRWLADRSHSLHVVETSSQWAEIIKRDLDGANCYWEVVLLQGPKDKVLVENPRSCVDLVLVDCVENLRADCAQIGWKWLRSGGWLVFDDAQRLMHTPTVIHMNKLAKPARLAWNKVHDIPQAKTRVALAWQKSA